MPIDPSIIGNVMAPQAPQLPDVNAMLETQTRGAENIFKIETARQQEAKLAQQEAAQAREAATIKALLPAYTYGIQTGDIAGALDLVPPEMQESLRPYVDALAGKSPQEVQAALIGSLSSSPAGQEALGAIQRAQTAQIQLGQLDVSRQNLALDRQKAQLDAEGKGAWELKEGEGGFFWVNPRTREVVPANVTGAAPGGVPGAAPGPAPIPAPSPSTDLVTPRQPAPGAPQVAPPISVAQPPAEQPGPQFKPKPKAEKAADLTEREGKSVNFAIRMADSDAIANELEKEGVVTTDTVSNFFTGVVNALPMSAGANLATQLENAFNAAMPTMSPEEQRLAGAQLDFITAVLRSESGAEIKTSEFPAEYRKYFAVAGDENNPKLLTDKKRRRRNAIEGMKAQAGERGRTEIDRILNEQGVGASAVTPPAPGATLDGFEYQGVEE